MANKNPTKAIHLLNQLKANVVEGDSVVDIEAMIVSAQAEVLAAQSSAIQADFKKVRIAKLRATDWSQLGDNVLEAPKKAEHDQYRIDLRALVVPTTQDELDAIVWPVDPS